MKLCRLPARVVLCLLTAGALHAQDAKAEAAARQAMDGFMTAFNSRDARAWAATLNYPHVRFASNQVRSYATAEEFAREMPATPSAWRPGITADGSPCRRSKVGRIRCILR